MKLRVVPSFVFAVVLSVALLDGCRSYDPAGPDVAGGTSMNPGSAGILRVRAIAATGSTGDFELDLFVTDTAGHLISNIPDSLFTMLSLGDTSFSLLGCSTGITDSIGPFSAELLIDQSLSMGENDPFDLRLKGAWVFLHGVDALRGGIDEVQLSSFCGYYPSDPSILGLRSYGPFSTSGASFDAGLQSLAGNLGYATPLYDAMAKETDSLVALSHNTNKALIVFTDGDDNASTYSLNAAIQHALDNNIKVFAIALKTGLIIDSLLHSQMPQDGSGSKALFSIAMSTGGAVMHTNDAKQAVAYYGGLGQVIHGHAPYFKTRWHVALPSSNVIAGTELRGQLHIKGSSVEAPFIVQF